MADATYGGGDCTVLRVPTLLFRTRPDTGEQVPILLDAADLPLLAGCRVFLQVRHSYCGVLLQAPRQQTLARGYASGSTQVLARFLLGLEKGDPREVDHENRDPLDNRRSNLRIVTTRENKHNRGIDVRNTSGYKGVHWHGRRQKWIGMVQWRRDGRRYTTSVGFDTPEEAAAWWDAKAREVHGASAVTNRDLGLLDGTTDL